MILYLLQNCKHSLHFFAFSWKLSHLSGPLSWMKHEGWRMGNKFLISDVLCWNKGLDSFGELDFVFSY